MLNIRRLRLKRVIIVVFGQKCLLCIFILQRVCNMKCSAVLNCFWILWSKLEKRRLYSQMRHIERQNDFCTKNANNRFLSKNREYWIDVRLCIVKLESGGQQLPVSKKNLSRNIFNLEKSSLLLKVLKTYVFTQITECSIVTHLHHTEL